MATNDLRVLYKIRPGSPYGPSGGMTYHHTIPANALRDVWNHFLANHFDEFRSTFLKPFSAALFRYPVCPNDAEAKLSFTASVGGQLKQIVAGALTHDPTATEPANWEWLRQAYIWMPGNLFHGPSNRAKGGGYGGDPEEGFDTFASRCMPQGHYNVLLNAYRVMEAYRRAPGGIAGARAARAAGQSLAAVANYDGLTAYNAAHWRGVILETPKPK